MRHPDPDLYARAQRKATSYRFAASNQSFGMRRGARVLNSHIDAISWNDCLCQIAEWADARLSRYVTFCNVHSVVTASEDPGFHSAIQQADLALPDGAPVAWVLKQRGFTDQARLNGPDLMWRYLAVASGKRQRIFLYGSTPETLSQLAQKIRANFPDVQIAGTLSPPFHALPPEEKLAHIDQINQSGAQVVFVGLGCPKQELWMSEHKGKVNAVMMGVGAAFDYHAGNVKRAPLWMQRHGLEWLHRLLSEPRRLAKRYGYTNCVFAVRILKDLLTNSPQ